MGENKFQKGTIYKVVDIAYSKCYIGSTCEKLCRRFARHKSSYAQYLKGNHNKNRCFSLFDEFGIENCKIELVEYFPCDTKEQLRQREGFHIKNTTCLNKYIAGRTHQEHYQDNIEHCNSMSKKNYQENRDRYIEMAKLNHIQNKEKHNNDSKKYYQKKKDVILLKRSEVIICGCGSNYTFSHKARHFNCKKHQNWLKQQESEEEPLQQSD